MKKKNFLIMIFSFLLFFHLGSKSADAMTLEEVSGKFSIYEDFINYSNYFKLDNIMYVKGINTNSNSTTEYLVSFSDGAKISFKERKGESGNIVTQVFESEIELIYAGQAYIYYKDGSDLRKNVLNLPIKDASYELLKGGLNDGIPPNLVNNVQYVINEDNSVTYTYDLPEDNDFSHLEIWQGATLLKDKHTQNEIKITDLMPGTSYEFKFISVDTSGNKSDAYISNIVMPEGPDLIPPLEISNLKHVVSESSVQFTYSLPIDDDFSHIQVWRGNEQIADNVKINSFKDENLDYETSYNYTFKTVDFTGNVSNGSSLTIKTMPYNDDIPPTAPIGLEIVTGNSSLSFSWIPNAENDVAGYNIYVDGIKINGSAISGNSYRLTNLSNGNEYKIQVSAIDTSGNESELSNSVIGVPDETKLPVFKVDTDLKSVAESTENWFSELWLILAFSAGIPISFLVGHRIKMLFFA